MSISLQINSFDYFHNYFSLFFYFQIHFILKSNLKNFFLIILFSFFWFSSWFFLKTYSLKSGFRFSSDIFFTSGFFIFYFMKIFSYIVSLSHIGFKSFLENDFDYFPFFSLSFSSFSGSLLDCVITQSLESIIGPLPILGGGWADRISYNVFLLTHWIMPYFWTTTTTTITQSVLGSATIVLNLVFFKLEVCCFILNRLQYSNGTS